MQATFSKNLSKEKKAELKKIVEIIKKHAQVEMIILFGSYARGDFVDYDEKEFEGHIESYASDFDIFVVVKNNKLEKDVNVWHKIDEEIGELIETKIIKTPVNIIPESIGHIEEQLEKKRYFYTDLVKDGVLLFSNGGFKLKLREGELSVEEKKVVAKEDFKKWFKKAKTAFEIYEFSFEKISKDKEHLNESAFNLHQTTERLFTALLLVFIGYKPKTHDLLWLDRQARKINADFKNIFPRNTGKEKHLFNLLKKAYVDSRYSKEYRITKTELKQIAKRVEKLMELTEKVCKEKIKSI